MVDERINGTLHPFAGFESLPAYEKGVLLHGKKSEAEKYKVHGKEQEACREKDMSFFKCRA